jgi:hypothetical protein
METIRDLAPDTWAEYLDALSKEFMNAPVSIEIVDVSGRPTIEVSHLDLHALSYDGRDDVFEVAVARRNGHVTIDSWTMLAPMTITVYRRDGVRTLIRIEGDPSACPNGRRLQAMTVAGPRAPKAPGRPTR